MVFLLKLCYFNQIFKNLLYVVVGFAILITVKHADSVRERFGEM